MPMAAFNPIGLNIKMSNEQPSKKMINSSEVRNVFIVQGPSKSQNEYRGLLLVKGRLN